MRSVDLLVRLEWAAAAALAVLAYAWTDGSWLTFALLILAPDLSMLAYLAGPRIGALGYNAAHILVMPALLAVIGWSSGEMLCVHLALIWTAHIAVDRALGYGLKLPSSFQDTHMGRPGR